MTRTFLIICSHIVLPQAPSANVCHPPFELMSVYRESYCRQLAATYRKLGQKAYCITVKP